MYSGIACIEDIDIIKYDKNIYIIDIESLINRVTILVVNLEALYIATSRNLVRLEIKS